MKYYSWGLIVLSLALSVASGAPVLGGGKAIPSQVKFTHGSSSTTLRGTLRRDEQKEYALTARAGQRITFRFTGAPSHSLRLTILEGYNGFGYRTRHPEVLSPYLWSYSNHYESGKYVADGTFSPSAVSQQCGAAILLRRMSETGTIQFDPRGVPLPAPTQQPANGAPLAQFEPLVRFSTTEQSPLAEELQRALDKFPGIFVKVDGIAGPRTSDAFRKVTGHYLLGDPRA